MQTSQWARHANQLLLLNRLSAELRPKCAAVSKTFYIVTFHEPRAYTPVFRGKLSSTFQERLLIKRIVSDTKQEALFVLNKVNLSKRC